MTWAAKFSRRASRRLEAMPAADRADCVALGVVIILYVYYMVRAILEIL